MLAQQMMIVVSAPCALSSACAGGKLGRMFAHRAGGKSGRRCLILPQRQRPSGSASGRGARQEARKQSSGVRRRKARAHGRAPCCWQIRPARRAAAAARWPTKVCPSCPRRTGVAPCCLVGGQHSAVGRLGWQSRGDGWRCRAWVNKGQGARSLRAGLGMNDMCAMGVGSQRQPAG